MPELTVPAHLMAPCSSQQTRQQHQQRGAEVDADHQQHRTQPRQLEAVPREEPMQPQRIASPATAPDSPARRSAAAGMQQRRRDQQQHRGDQRQHPLAPVEGGGEAQPIASRRQYRANAYDSTGGASSAHSVARKSASAARRAAQQHQQSCRPAERRSAAPGWPGKPVRRAELVEPSAPAAASSTMPRSSLRGAGRGSGLHGRNAPARRDRCAASARNSATGTRSSTWCIVAPTRPNSATGQSGR